MDKEQLYSEIFEDVNTVQEVLDFTKQIDALLDVLYVTKNSFAEKMELMMENSIKDRILRGMEKLAIESSNTGSIEVLLQDLKKKIKSYPTMRMELAYKPTGSHILHISEWIVYNLKQKVILDIIVKPDLMAGAVIGFGGKVFDASLKKKIEGKEISLLELKSTDHTNTGTDVVPQAQEPGKEVEKVIT